MILSIDVGLRNLSMCIMDCSDKKDLNTYEILLWDVYNTLDSDDYHCEGIMKSGKVCGKKCSMKYKVADTTAFNYSCKSHFPKEIKQNKTNIFKKKMIKDYLLQDIVKIVLNRLKDIYFQNKETFDKLKEIIIELQPKINPKMKMVSHIIYGKLVEIFEDKQTTIRFVRASQKLRAYTGPEIECKLKGAYAKRKWLSIQYVTWFLENKFSNEQKTKWLESFLNCTKRDDRSDTALMAINCLYGIPKKQLRNKNGSEIK